MPLPHESFTPAFTKQLKACLTRARARGENSEVWALLHFDQYVESVETFHSHSGLKTKVYREQLDRLATQNPGPANYGLNTQLAKYRATHAMAVLPAAASSFVDMHAEEELITGFQRIYDDWIVNKPAPKICCIYLNFSPCARSAAKVINGESYPVGCMHKLVHFARQYRHRLFFTVYYDALFNQPDAATYQAALAGVLKEGFISFAPMPSELASYPEQLAHKALTTSFTRV